MPAQSENCSNLSDIHNSKLISQHYGVYYATVKYTNVVIFIGAPRFLTQFYFYLKF